METLATWKEWYILSLFYYITIINCCQQQPSLIEQLFRNASAPPPHTRTGARTHARTHTHTHTHTHTCHTYRVTPSNKQASSSTPVHPVLVWPWSIEAPSHISFLWSSCQTCNSVANNYLSADRNRFDLESGPWTIRPTRGKETLYQVPIKFAHWRLKSTLLGSVQFCCLYKQRQVLLMTHSRIPSSDTRRHFIFCCDMMTRVVYFSATFQ